jgi:hypothetical protein
MSTRDQPFNIQIMRLTPERLQRLKPVKSLDILEGATKNFHEDGLFSVSIFGRFGDERRDHQFSYIDLKTQILHPLIYETFCKLTGLYRGIMNGKEYALWDAERKDFVASDMLNGETGFSFFMNHCFDVEFETSKSPTRKERIALIRKYADVAKTEKVLVLPAGLRDVEVGDDGRMRQHECNDLYRRLIAVSNLISRTTNPNDPAVNQSRASLQLTFLEIYDLFRNTIAGKGGFMQNKFASRRVFNGTQNVISAMDPSCAIMGSPNSVSVTDTVVGLFQMAKAIEPVTIGFLKRSILNGIFGGNKGYLINPKTLTPEYVTLNAKTIDYWTSVEGLAKVIEAFREPSIRHKPILVSGHFLSLTYCGPDGTFKLFNDINDLPEDRNRKDVHPTTLAELLYISGYQHWNSYPEFVTRYPITGIGSIYPSKTYMKTTIEGEIRKELGPDWQPMGDSYVAYEFPSRDKPEFVDSMSPHLSRLSMLGAD